MSFVRRDLTRGRLTVQLNSPFALGSQRAALVAHRFKLARRANLFALDPMAGEDADFFVRVYRSSY